MIKSMTGFGRAKFVFDNIEYSIELKAVNSRYLDMNIKLPRNISFAEDLTRRIVSSNISRGKIDVFINFTVLSGKLNVSIDESLAKEYIEIMKRISKDNNISESILSYQVLNMPNVMSQNSDLDEDCFLKEYENALLYAIKQFNDMRMCEGEKLLLDIQNRLIEIEKNVIEVSKYSHELVPKYIEKLQNRLNELLKNNGQIEQSRLAEEAVIYADKTSIEEEVTRLKSHISQFNNILKEEKPIGKKLDFLMQEMNREVNTIGSKGNCLDISNMVVIIKTELENIREQIQNIE